MVCHRDNVEIEHLPIYVIGSEGLNVCHPCKMLITDFVRGLISLYGRFSLAARKAAKNESL